MARKRASELSLSFPAPCSRWSEYSRPLPSAPSTIFSEGRGRLYTGYAPASPFASHLSISLKWRACSQAVMLFIVVRDVASHRHYNGSVDSKCTHTPKSICQVLTSIWPSTSKEERIKLIKLSSVTKPVNSNHFNQIYLQLLEEIAPSLRKKQPCSKLKSIPVL